MIEIKITIDSALSLLLERMNLELKIRQRDKIVPRGVPLESLSYNQLLPIVEASVFDTIFLLPMDLVAQDTNLINIITMTVKALSRILHKSEFQNYSFENSAALIQPIIGYFRTNIAAKDYQNN